MFAPPSQRSPARIIWWLLIGTNDMVSGGCSIESVLVGILELVHTLLDGNEKAIVVMNSILPRSLSTTGDVRDGTLWNDISWINERLACLAQGDAAERLHFFNATLLFLRDEHYINETLMPDMLHPSAEGSRVWGVEIVTQVNKLLAD